MRVLVVGGAGYIGGAVVDLLLGAGHEVRVYDGLLYEEAYRKPVQFIFGDVRDEEALLAAPGMGRGGGVAGGAGG